MANHDQSEDIDFPLGNPRSHLRRDLDAHAGLVSRRHSVWVDDEGQSSILPVRRRQHFSAWNALEMLSIVDRVTDPINLLGGSWTDPRVRHLLKALRDAGQSAGAMLGWQTSQVLSGIVASVVPALLEMVKWAAVGAVTGGALGAVGGLGVADELTIPGGALAGAELGIMAAGFRGLANMLKEAGVHAGAFMHLVSEATVLALYAGENQGVDTGGGRGFSFDEDMRDASELYAAALGELWWIVLQAIVVWVMKKAVEIGGPAAVRAVGRAARSEALQSAIGEAKGQVSHLGGKFCDWLDKDFEAIRELVARHEKAARDGESGGNADQATGSVARPQQGKSRTALPVSRVKTDPNTAFFWSGRTNGVGGEKIAQQYSKAAGGTTLEQLIEARGIEMPDFNPNDPATVKAWQDISAEYSQGASGTVRAVVGQDLRTGNIWQTSELPTLMSNPNVTKIIQVDPASGVESVIFER